MKGLGLNYRLRKRAGKNLKDSYFLISKLITKLQGAKECGTGLRMDI